MGRVSLQDIPLKDRRSAALVLVRRHGPAIGSKRNFGGKEQRKSPTVARQRSVPAQTPMSEMQSLFRVSMPAPGLIPCLTTKSIHLPALGRCLAPVQSPAEW